MQDVKYEYYTGYTETALVDLVNIMFDCVKFMNEKSSIYKKYGHKRYYRTSVFVKQYVADNLANEVDYYEAIKKINE